MPSLVLFIGLGQPTPLLAADGALEQGRLAAVLRQLDAIDRLVAQEAMPDRAERARYHFDYARLTTDLERVRAGIHDYLAPARAQPRDPVDLSGTYRRDDGTDNGNSP